MKWKIYDSLDVSKSVSGITTMALGKRGSDRFWKYIDSKLNSARQREMDRKFKNTDISKIKFAEEKKNFEKAQQKKKDLDTKIAAKKNADRKRLSLKKQELKKQELKKQELKKQELKKRELRRKQNQLNKQLGGKKRRSDSIEKKLQEFKKKHITRELRKKEEFRRSELSKKNAEKENVPQKEVRDDKLRESKSKVEKISREEQLKIDRAFEGVITRQTTIREDAKRAERIRIESLEHNWKKSAEKELASKMAKFEDRHKKLGTEKGKLESLRKMQKDAVRQQLAKETEEKRRRELERQNVVSEQQKKMEKERNEGRFRLI